MRFVTTVIGLVLVRILIASRQPVWRKWFVCLIPMGFPIQSTHDRDKCSKVICMSGQRAAATFVRWLNIIIVRLYHSRFLDHQHSVRAYCVSTLWCLWFSLLAHFCIGIVPNRIKRNRKEKKKGQQLCYTWLASLWACNSPTPLNCTRIINSLGKEKRHAR